MLSQTACPHCGHVNFEQSVYCFECHTVLADRRKLDGLLPRYYDLFLKKEIKPFEPLALKVVKDRKKNRDFLMHLDNGLVCLRCSAENSYNALNCHQCNAQLNRPDEVYGLRAIGSAQSSIGQGRTLNEDEVGLWGRGNVLIALVADGMGGAAAGEEASRYVREAVHAFFTGVVNGSETLGELTEREVAQRLRAASTLANQTIMDRIEKDSSVRGMGTTLTIAFIRGRRAVIAHVGDSRAYEIKADGTVMRVTDDHSFVEVLVASGHITRRQAAIHPMRSVLYRALGHVSSNVIDAYYINLDPGDRLILCSDGLIRHVNTIEIARIAHDTQDAADIGEGLIELANHRGGEDNISVASIVIEADNSEVPAEELYLTPYEVKMREMAEHDADPLTSTRQFPAIDPDTLP